MLKKSSYILILFTITMGCSDENRKIYYSNGVLKEIVSIKDGKMNGEYKSYYPSGELRSKGYFENDFPTGTHLSYFKNGSLKYEQNYHLGILNGKEVRYTMDGHPTEIAYRKEGKKFGDYFFLDSLSKDTLAYMNFFYDTIMYQKIYMPKSRNIQKHSMEKEIALDPDDNSSLCFSTYAPVDINLKLIVGEFVGDNYEIPDTLDTKTVRGVELCYEIERREGLFQAHLMELNDKEEVIGGTLIDIKLEDYF